MAPVLKKLKKKKKKKKKKEILVKWLCDVCI